MSYSIFVPKNKTVFSGYYQIQKDLGNPNTDNSISFLNYNIFSDIRFDENYFKEFLGEFYSKKDFICYLSFFSKFASKTDSNILFLGRRFLSGPNLIIDHSYKNVNLTTSPSTLYTTIPLLYPLLKNQTVAIGLNSNTTNLISINSNRHSIEIFTNNS